MTDATHKKAGKTPASIDLDAAAIKDLTPPAPTPEAKAGPAAGAEARLETETAAPPATPAAAEKPGKPADEPARPTLHPAKPSSTGPVFGGAVAGALFGVLTTLVYHNVKAPPVTVADPRLAKVEADLAALPAKAETAAREAAKALTSQIADLEKKLAASENKAAAATEAAKTATEQAKAATDRAAALETLAAGMIAPVDDRLKSTEIAVGEARSATAALSRRLEEIAKAGSQPSVAVSAVSGKIEALEKALGAAGASAKSQIEATGGLEARLKQLEGLMAGQKPAASPRPAALLAAAALIRQNWDAGRPLGVDAPALTALGLDEAVAKPLAVYAVRPVPNAAALASQLTALAATFPRPAPAPQPEKSIFDKMKANVLSFVEIRPTGSGATPANDAVATLRSRIAAGDGKAALDAIAALTTEQRAILTPLTAALTEREAAAAALRKLESDALAGASRKD